MTNNSNDQAAETADGETTTTAEGASSEEGNGTTEGDGDDSEVVQAEDSGDSTPPGDNDKAIETVEVKGHVGAKFEGEMNTAEFDTLTQRLRAVMEELDVPNKKVILHIETK